MIASTSRSPSHSTIVCRATAALALVLTAASACGPGDPPASYFFFTLEEGTPVDLELTAVEVDPGTTLSTTLNGVLLDTPGESARIGVAVEGLHTHPLWVATVPAGAPVDDFTFSLSFRLTTAAAEYQGSDPYTVSFELVDGPPDPEDSEILLGSSLNGGGQLVAQYDFDTPIPLFFEQCLGGSGDDCAGGVRVYSAINPGFAPRE